MGIGNVFSLQMQEAFEEAPSFDDFWVLQVRKEAKKDARRQWDRLDPEKQALAIIGAAEWRPVWFARGDTKYIPLPATWLSGERWDDELPSEFRSAAHVPMKPRAEDSTKYVPMPESVKQLLAKLRAK